MENEILEYQIFFTWVKDLSPLSEINKKKKIKISNQENSHDLFIYFWQKYPEDIAIIGRTKRDVSDLNAIELMSIKMDVAIN